MAINRAFQHNENGVPKPYLPADPNIRSFKPLVYNGDENQIESSDHINLERVDVTEQLHVTGDTQMDGEVIMNEDLVVRRNLYVEGSTTTTNETTLDTSGDYIVLRHNTPTSLDLNEKSGIVVHNYVQGKSAAIAVDKDGIWRVSDNELEETDVYTNVSNYNNNWYIGIGRDTTEVARGSIVAADYDVLDNEVWYDGNYYHWNTAGDWYGPITIVDDHLNEGDVISDTDLISTLESLDKYELIYYRSLTILEINDESNQPILTREEADNLADGAPLVWDSENNRAITSSTDSGNQVLKSVMNEDGSISYEWGSSGSGSVWRGTREELDEALSITDPNNENYIPNNALLIVTDSEQTYLIGDTMEAE